MSVTSRERPISLTAAQNTGLQIIHDAFYGLSDEPAQMMPAMSLHRNPLHEDDDTHHVDRIERYLNHLEYCCRIYQGIDVYQLLAFRRFNKLSREARPNRPLKLLGCNWEIKIHSDFLDCVLTAIVVGLLQLVGISVILYETAKVYFELDQEQALCEYDADTWRRDWVFKMLAFLFAAMISIQLNKTILSQRHSGFNEALSSIALEDFGKLYFIDIALIQFGLLINVYTLFCAVIGSFFLVYASEGGEHALEMVLNSISLFFMVGLDDLLVSTSDYEDVEDYMMEYYREYMQRKKQSKPMDENIGVQCCGYKGLSACDKIVDTIQFVLVSATYIGGVIAPVLIAICW